jgi:hypothetical protein
LDNQRMVELRKSSYIVNSYLYQIDLKIVILFCLYLCKCSQMRARIIFIKGNPLFQMNLSKYSIFNVN